MEVSHAKEKHCPSHRDRGRGRRRLCRADHRPCPDQLRRAPVPGERGAHRPALLHALHDLGAVDRLHPCQSLYRHRCRHRVRLAGHPAGGAVHGLVRQTGEHGEKPHTRLPDAGGVQRPYCRRGAHLGLSDPGVFRPSRLLRLQCPHSRPRRGGRFVSDRLHAAASAAEDQIVPRICRASESKIPSAPRGGERSHP